MALFKKIELHGSFMYRRISLDHQRKIFLYNLIGSLMIILSMIIGCGVGSFVGTLLFPGLGTLIGIGLGIAIGGCIGSLGLVLLHKIMGAGFFSVPLSTIGYTLVAIAFGAVLGTCLLPGVGTLLGAATIGAGVLTVASIRTLDIYEKRVIRHFNQVKFSPLPKLPENEPWSPEAEASLDPEKNNNVQYGPLFQPNLPDANPDNDTAAVSEQAPSPDAFAV